MLVPSPLKIVPPFVSPNQQSKHPPPLIHETEVRDSCVRRIQVWLN